VIAPLGESKVSTNGLATQTQQALQPRTEVLEKFPTPGDPALRNFPLLQTQMEAVIAIAQNQVEMLSQKVGAKTLAEMVLDLCTLEEIRELHAELSLNLESLGKEE